MRIGENEEILDIPSKGISVKAEYTPVLGVLGGKARLFYRDEEGARMATLDSSSGEATDISPVYGMAISIVKGKGKSLVLWRIGAETELFGSFFDESTLQWGNLFSLGGNYWDLFLNPVTAAFDGNRFLVARLKEYPYALEVLWLDPLEEGVIEDSKKITQNNVINLALACLGPEDCICTFSEPPKPSSPYLMATHLSSPGDSTPPEPIYPNGASFYYSSPRSYLFAKENHYIFSTVLEEIVSPNGGPVTSRMDRLGKDGKFQENILRNENSSKEYTTSFAPGSAYLSYGKNYLYGKKFDTTIKEQEIAPVDFNVIDLDFPATRAFSAKFWQGDFWVSFTLSRTEPNTGAVIQEFWLNRINLQGEIVASHQVAGHLLATGNSRALLASEKALFLMDPSGSYQKIMDLHPSGPENYLFDGIRFVAWYSFDGTSLLYIEEDGTIEERKFPPDILPPTYWNPIQSASCKEGSCVFSISKDNKISLLEIPFQKNHVFWPGTLNDLNPQISQVKLQFDGESLLAISHVSFDFPWFLRLNKENITQSELIAKIPYKGSIEGKFFPYNNRVILGTQNEVLYFDGQSQTTIGYINKEEKIFSPNQDNEFLIQFYSQISPQAPTHKSFSSIWRLQDDAPGGGPSSGGEGGGGGSPSSGGEGGVPPGGGTGNSGDSPSSQGGTDGGFSAGSPSGADENTAGKHPGEGPPQTQAFPSEERGGCGCRWGTTAVSSPSMASLLAAFALAQRRRRRTLR